MNRGPLILVEDDMDDQELLMIVLRKLGFQDAVKVFDCADDALAFLFASTERPFLILSDINMPKMDGIAFRRAIEQSQQLRSLRIPFVFISTSDTGLKAASDLDVQGYFEKGSTMQELYDTLQTILAYWQNTRHLN